VRRGRVLPSELLCRAARFFRCGRTLVTFSKL
jgi:hypothetical protein